MTHKRLEGRDEPILDPEIAIVGSHHHLFELPALRYMLDEYLGDARAGHRIVASVYVETRAFARPDGPEVLRPLGEVEFANGVGAVAASGVGRNGRTVTAMSTSAEPGNGSWNPWRPKTRGAAPSTPARASGPGPGAGEREGLKAPRIHP